MSSQEYILNLPYPPSINNYYGITCNGNIPHKYIKPTGKTYKKEVLDYITTNNLDIQANIPVKVAIIISPPDRRKRDIDNILKCLFDSLTEANFWQDDSIVKELHISYSKVEKQGSVLLHIQPL